MQSIANVFLILFLNSAIIGIAATLFGASAAPDWLPALLDFVTRMTTFFGLVVYLGFSFNRHLPKKILLPPLLLLLWNTVDYWPLDAFQQLMPFAWLLLLLWVLQRNRKLNKRSLLMTREQFAGPAFNSGTFIRFSLLNILVLPLVVILLSFSSVSNLIDDKLAGFMRLKPNGLYMVEKIYRKGEKQIHLSGMIHLGQASYFDNLSRTLQGQQAIVLLEGVTDRSGRLQQQFSYQKLAELLGLNSQEQLQLSGRLVDSDSLHHPADIEAGTTDLLHADIDLSEFNQRTIDILNALGKYLLNNDSILDGLRQFNQWSEANIKPEDNQIIMDDLVRKRNRTLLSYLPDALEKYDRVIIPWGAMHMPGLEIAVRNRGFSLQSQQQRLSINFLQLPYRSLLEQSTIKD